MPALLSVTYTPNYIGNHRICFRTTQVSYCCYTDDSFSVIGVPKTTVIDLDEFETCLQDLPVQVGCEGSVVDGYIQPFCVDQGSDLNRVSFTATFASNPCTPYRIECTESGIGEISVINPGYGWPVGVAPTVTVNTSGSGIGFSATATMECLPGDNFCSIDSVVIDNTGFGYFYPNQLSIEVDPLPSCISNNLITNGDFTTDLSGWTLTPAPDIFYWDSGAARYNNTLYGATTPGFINQDILTPGTTYEITIDTIALLANTGYCQIIISAGTFDISGTQPNQFSILRLPTDPLYTTPITVTLTCTGSTSFNIYAYTTATDPGSIIRFSEVSVAELCDVVEPELEITLLDNCGTFTLSNCDGSNNPVEYEIQGTPAYAINVCSGGVGPIGAKYTITSNPVYYGIGPELVVNGSFTNDLNGWTVVPPGSEPDVFWTPQGVQFTNPDEQYGIAQDILVPGRNYIIDITLTCDYGPSYVGPVPSNEIVFELYFGTNLLAPISFNGIEQSFQFDYVPCYGNGIFKLMSFDATSPFPSGVTRLCSYISIRDMDVEYPVSCCDCVKHDIFNSRLTGDAIEFYYTDCVDQTIKTGSVDAGGLSTYIELCAVRQSVWAVNPQDNQYLLTSISNTQDC